MKALMLTGRILLGLIFVVFGLNGFLQFLPLPPLPDAAKAFFAGMAATGYMLPLLFAAQVLGGVLLLVGLVPLGLLILAPVIVNIVLFHIFLAPEGLPLAIVVAIVEFLLAWAHRKAFVPLFGFGS